MTATSPSPKARPLKGLAPLTPQESPTSQNGGEEVDDVDEEMRNRLAMARTWGDDLSSTLQRMLKRELQEFGKVVSGELQAFREDLKKTKQTSQGTAVHRTSLASPYPQVQPTHSYNSDNSSYSVTPPGSCSHTDVAVPRGSMVSNRSQDIATQSLSLADPSAKLKSSSGRASTMSMTSLWQPPESGNFGDKSKTGPPGNLLGATKSPRGSGNLVPTGSEPPETARAVRSFKVLKERKEGSKYPDHVRKHTNFGEDVKRMNNQISEVEKDKKEKMQQLKSKSLTFGNVLFDSERSISEEGKNGAAADTCQIVQSHPRRAYGKLSRSVSSIHGLKLMERIIPNRVKRLYDIVARIVCSDSFNGVSGFIVIMNSISIGVQTDYIAREQTQRVPVEFRFVELTFCVLFSIELMMRLFVHRCQFFTMPGRYWNWFDFVVVMLQVVEEVTEASANVVDLSAMRVLRVLRLIRVVRFIRVIHLIGELRTLATSIMSSMRSLMWTVVMLLLLMFIVGVALTQIVSDYRIRVAADVDLSSVPLLEDEELANLSLRTKFGSVYRSILTLYQCNTGGMDWKDAVDPLHDFISPWLAFFFCIYVAFVVLAIMNVVTGVFVESALKSAKDDKETVIVNHMRELFAGSEGNELTWDAFTQLTGTPEMLDYFQTIDVDPSEAAIVFKLLDIDGSGAVGEDEFTCGCLKLTGPAKALDLAILSHEVRAVSCWLQTHMVNVERILDPEHHKNAHEVESLFLVHKEGFDKHQSAEDPDYRSSEQSPKQGENQGGYHTTHSVEFPSAREPTFGYHRSATIEQRLEENRKSSVTSEPRSPAPATTNSPENKYMVSHSPRGSEDVSASSPRTCQDEITCPCGTTFLGQAAFCRKCGKPRPAICACGVCLADGAMFCRKCGQRRSDKQDAHPDLY